MKISIGIFIGIALSFVIFLTYLNFNAKPGIPPIAVIPTVTSTPATPTSTNFNNPDFGILTWNNSPVKIANPQILNTATSSEYGGYTFADIGTIEVGKFSTGAKLIVTFVIPEGPSISTPYRFVVQNNNYYLVESLLNDDTKKNIEQVFDMNKIKLISFRPKEMFYNNYYPVGQMSYMNSSFGGFLPNYINNLKVSYSTISQTSSGKLISTNEPVTISSGLVNKYFYLQLPDFTLVNFKQQSNLGESADKVPYFRLLDSTTNTNQFTNFKSGCGGDGNVTTITNQSILDSKTLIGRADNNSFEIFQIKSVDSPLVKFLYDQYKVGRDYPSAPAFLPLDQFANSPNHIIYQEKNGEWVIKMNPNYSVQAECGKPVVYLYPTTNTQVSVKVGADVTKSEPLYPQDGWTVLAHPNGQLDYQNNSYPNLFWEGTGHGFYNSHQGEGFVVAQSQLVSTIISQLKQQGLNTQEIDDFMQYWTPKLPTTPYVRLTWLNTADMNQLAPLQVFPSPKTVIRVFLDFEGLQTPVELTPQKFTTPKRTGFTLVEWGGLLIK